MVQTNGSKLGHLMSHVRSNKKVNPLELAVDGVTLSIYRWPVLPHKRQPTLAMRTRDVGTNSRVSFKTKLFSISACTPCVVFHCPLSQRMHYFHWEFYRDCKSLETRRNTILSEHRSRTSHVFSQFSSLPLFFLPFFLIFLFNFFHCVVLFISCRTPHSASLCMFLCFTK
jgi:hypothetical protein